MAITRLQPFNLDTTKSYTFGNVTAVGNVSANYLIGNGSQLTGVTTIANSISSGTSNIFIVSSGGNIAVGVGGTGNVVVWATTGQYVTGLLSVSGNITGGNILTDGLLSVNGNITASNISTSGSGGNITGANVISATTFTATGNINGGNLATGGLFSAGGNVTGGNLTTAGLTSTTNFNITGNVTGNLLPSANGIYSLGSPDQLWSNLYLTGNTITLGSQTLSSNTVTVITSNNFQAANIDALYNITTIGVSASGNITGSNLLINNDATITGNLVVNGNTTFINSNVITTNDKSITLANNQSTAANVDGAGIDIGNTTIAYWRFNNTTTSWQSNVGLTPAANATLNLGGATNYWGNAYIDAVNTNTFSAVGNVIGGNLLTGGLISATSTITSAANITGGNLLTSGYLSVAGNATITGDLSVTGNIIGVLQDHGSDSNNWDAITRMGTYTVNRVSWAGTSGTPLDSQVFVGLLEVLNSSEVAISQVFYPGTIETGNVNIQWNRSNWANVWSPWIKIINNDQIVSGGEF